MTPADLEIRQCDPEDAEDVARLSGELGYPASAADIEQRIRDFSISPDRAVFVAHLSGTGVVGWIDVAIVQHLQSGASAEIGGLVVRESARSSGIGKMLVTHAEAWAAQRGMRKIRVHSQVKRTDAHRFYQRENYSLLKTSAVFEKDL